MNGILIEDGLVTAHLHGVSEGATFPDGVTFIACDLATVTAAVGEPYPWPRAERDRLLSASDWTQVPDAPLTGAQRDAWAAYRQQLRDLPDTSPDPLAVEWPAKPE